MTPVLGLAIKLLCLPLFNKLRQIQPTSFLGEGDRVHVLHHFTGVPNLWVDSRFK